MHTYLVVEIMGIFETSNRTTHHTGKLSVLHKNKDKSASVVTALPSKIDSSETYHGDVRILLNYFCNNFHLLF